jgi:hypothetical protein
MDLNPEELQQAINATLRNSSTYQGLAESLSSNPEKEDLYLRLALAESHKFNYFIAIQSRFSTQGKQHHPIRPPLLRSILSPFALSFAAARYSGPCPMLGSFKIV